jgi:hypothetical protein
MFTCCNNRFIHNAVHDVWKMLAEATRGVVIDGREGTKCLFLCYPAWRPDTYNVLPSYSTTTWK